MAPGASTPVQSLLTAVPHVETSYVCQKFSRMKILPKSLRIRQNHQKKNVPVIWGERADLAEYSADVGQSRRVCLAKIVKVRQEVSWKPITHSEKYCLGPHADCSDTEKHTHLETHWNIKQVYLGIFTLKHYEAVRNSHTPTFRLRFRKNLAAKTNPKTSGTSPKTARR